MEPYDITDILHDWPYDPQRNIRRISLANGTEKLQVRLPLGVEQYELDGRPDGQRPEGYESYLHLFKKRAQDAEESATLSSEECGQLHEEGVLYYFRYYLCFQIGDLERVIRDTRRNLEMFDFVDEQAPSEEDRVRVDQHRPYVLRMLGSATALKYAGKEKYEPALRVLRETIDAIENMPEVPTETFLREKKRSLAILRGMTKEIKAKRPPSEKENLQQRLEKAVLAEDYERAARLRDVLQAMSEAAERKSG